MTTTAVTRNKGWTANDATFGARLALVRQRMGWGSVAEAARACGQPIESWRTWERDGVEPRRIVTIAKQISSTVGCDYIWLLAGPDEGGGEVMPPTRQYAQPSRLIASIGDRDRTVAHPTRPVRRTRPTSAARPFTPTAA